MKTSLNLLKLGQNLTLNILREYHHSFRQKITPTTYPVSTINIRTPIDNIRGYQRILGLDKIPVHSEIKEAYYNLVKQNLPENRREIQLNERYKEILEAYNKGKEHDKNSEIKNIRSHTNPVGSERQLTKTVSLYENIKLRDLMKKDLPRLKPGAPEVNPSFQCSEASINIDFLHSVVGLKRDFVLKVLRKCGKCCGTYSHKSQLEKCKKCDGLGLFRVQTKTHIANKTCDICKGKRHTTKTNCSKCNNKGFVYENQPVHIAIPAGVLNGDVITIKNPNSDLLNANIAVKINVRNSSKFRRDGFNIHSDLILSIPDAVLGTRCKVQTIHGYVDLRIPPGVDSHSKITLYGKGVRTLSSIGDHIVTLKIEIPKTVNENVRKILSMWDNLEIKKPPPDH